MKLYTQVRATNVNEYLTLVSYLKSYAQVRDTNVNEYLTLLSYLKPYAQVRATKVNEYLELLSYLKLYTQVRAANSVQIQIHHGQSHNKREKLLPRPQNQVIGKHVSVKLEPEWTDTTATSP